MRALSLLLVVLFSSHSLAAPLVKTVTAKQQMYAKPIHISGIIEHKTLNRLAFKIPGFIEAIHVQQGEAIKKGQLLASLDLEEIQAELQQAQANTILAKNEFERAQRLFKQNMLSQAQLDQAQAQMDVAKAIERKAQFNLRHAQIKAPADGVILHRLIEKNEMLAAGSPAFIVSTQQDGWIIKATVADKDFMRLSLGDPASVYISALGNDSIPAKISELPASAGPFQTYTIELSIEQSNKQLVHGLVGQINIQLQQKESVILLPSSAMVRATRPQNNQALYSEIDIFVLNSKQQAELRKVVISTIDGEQLVVIKGLEQGEQVITAGSAYLTHLQDVTVQD